MPLKGRIDLRSDTFTEPTPAMRQAMAECAVGDDVWEMDPTVKELEELGASLFGKESSLFVPSSVMANLIAVMTHTSGRGEEILVGDKSHISLYEQGNVSTIGGVHVRTLKNAADGTFDIAELKQKIRPNNVHFPVTSLVCLESTHNMCGGSVLSQEFIRNVRSEIPTEVKLHLDGARVFNALAALDISPLEYTKDFDSITVCLSKGLAAPIGSLLIGSASFIAKGRRLRKALGGGMRQAGVIACCGIIGLKEMSKRLSEDHANAQVLYHHLKQISNIQIPAPQTNIVKFSIPGINLDGLCKLFAQANIFLITVDDGTAIRAVTHYHITREDCQVGAEAMVDIITKVQAGLIQVQAGDRMY